MIQDQVKLPWRVAAGVVMQGIRIRFGRSLVTITGVVLGIAFLMSTLAGQAIKEAVHEEDQVRIETKRMANFLAAEMGPPKDRILGVVHLGPLNGPELRLIYQLTWGGLRRLQWCQIDTRTPVPLFPDVDFAMAPLETVARDTSCVLVVGGNALPDALTQPQRLVQLFDGAKERILALGRPEMRVEAVPGVTVAPLSPEPQPDEIAKAQEEQRNARFRAKWLVVASLIVTVVGIANAMLMSVTERFREIGTMKCLGALSSFVRWMFFVESSFMGAVGGALGACLGGLFSLTAYSLTYGFDMVFLSVDFTLLFEYVVLSLLAGIVLSVIAAIYPASVAAAMIPAHALRTNV